jgi:hypothetical protein
MNSLWPWKIMEIMEDDFTETYIEYQTPMDLSLTVKKIRMFMRKFG